MEPDVQVIRAELRAEIRQGMADLREHFDARFDDAAETRDQMHAENRANFRDLTNEARITNGRVTRLEEIVKTLTAEFQGIRERWHKFRESIQDKIGVGSGENRRLVTRDVTLVAGGFALFYAIAKLFKWIP